MKRYDSYKPSGVEWIGEIPSLWSVNRLKFEIGLHGRIGWNGLRSDEFQVVSHAYLVTGQDFEGSDIPWDKCYQIDKERYEEDPFIQLKEGDILVTKDGSIGKVAMVRNLDKPACLNSGIFVLKQKHNAFNQLYLYWLLNSDIFKGFISYHQSGSTILHLYQNVFDNMPTVIPPMKEQIIMADYLDKKCGEIDRSIAKQQRRIELLEELKQSVITQAVTRGLDPNVPLRDTGIEWIGQIPEHWKVKSIKRTIILLTDYDANGSFADIAKNVHVNIGIPYAWMVRSTDLSNKRYGIVEGNNYCDKETYEFLNKSKLVPGDVLIAKRGDIGKCFEVPACECPMTLAPNTYLLKVNRQELVVKFFLYYFMSHYGSEQLKINNKSTAIGALYKDDVKNMSISLPPISEQQAIADYLDQRCAEIDSMVAREKKKIELMQELKQSIITEVVTGKRKVV